MGHGGHGHQHEFSERFSTPEGVAEYARQSQKLPFRNAGLWSTLGRLAPSGKWLDLGCGPGILTIELALRYPELHIVGIDSSEHMIGFARERVAEAGLADRVEFKIGDATDAGVLGAPESVDGIISTYTLHHFEDGVAALRTMASALTPGSPLLLYDFRRIWWLKWWGPINDAYRPRQAARLMTEAGLTGVRAKAHFPYAMTVVGTRPDPVE